MSGYFGPPWPSVVCETGPVLPTPVGHIDPLCNEPIQEGEAGSWFADGQPFHRECSLRSVIGGIEHLTAGSHPIGSCYRGSPLSYRESALLAWKWVADNGFPDVGGIS